ncbi:MATE family efflux transporter [Metamycoplasma canadense]|uniref:Probable multidrug resistance protein NorM n=1 Tax=Metamycoplasma canadense TaxID=29554 RepID=A0A077L8K1_9BACT|nr:MATE family efflux transporter [Metamycoplasma canadense]BAP39373.1 hypothetical protein MCAN360_0089 [Metamycoplasma canadense]
MNQKILIKSKKNYFKKFLPNSKIDWKNYFLKTWPIIIGEILFCLNGFLDNFMVSHIPSGIDALTYANTYTGIIYTFFFAIQGIAAMFVGQYYGKKDYNKVKQIMNLRIWIYLFTTILVSIICWSKSDMLIHLIGGKQINNSALNEARMYLMLICISWIITSFNFNTNMQLNETGHSNLAFVSACLTLISNASINAILLYGFKLDAYYAAFGSIASAIVCLTSDSLLTYFKDRAIFINIFKIYYITKPIAKQILKRIPAMLIAIIAMITIPIRMIIWSRAFPDDLINGSGVGEKWMGINAVTILGLVESLASIAAAITSACSSNVSYFVASNLGRSNFNEAEKHANSLKGFHTTLGFLMSLIMLGIVFAIAYSPSTSKGSQKAISQNIKLYLLNSDTNLIQSIFLSQKENKLIDKEIIKNAQNIFEQIKNNKVQLSENDLKAFFADKNVQIWINEMKIQIKNTFIKTFLFCCLTFIAMNPMWCWFYTTAALPAAGGRNLIGSFTMLFAHWLSFIWLIVLTFAIIIPYRNSGSYSMSLELAYFLFFSIDFIRLIIFETVAAKTNWKRNITEETKLINI